MKCFLNIVLLLAVLLPGACSRKSELVVYAVPGVQGVFWPSESGGGLGVLKNMASSDPRPRLVLGGDGWFLGTPEGVQDKGLSAAMLMKEAGFDAVVAGADEFTFGWKNLQYIVLASSLPALSSNIRGPGKEQFLHSSVVKDFGAFKFGVIGLMVDEQHQYSAISGHSPGLPVKNELEFARELAKSLKQKGVQFVAAALAAGRQEPVALSRQRAAELASAVPELALVLAFSRVAREAEVFKSGQSWIVICPHMNGHLLRLELSLNPASDMIKDVRALPVKLDAAIFGEDKKIAEAVGELRASADSKLGRRITVASQELAMGEPLGNWAADCLLRWGKGQAALLNKGALRAGIPAGIVTEKTMYRIYPQDDTVMLVKIRGAELRQALEQSLDSPQGGLFVAGVQASYSKSAPSGSRIKSVKVDGSALSDGRLYKVLVTDFMLAGEEGYTGLSQAVEFANTHEPVRKVLRWCMAKNRSISAPKDSRWLEDKK